MNKYSPIRYATIAKISEETGYSVESIRSLKKKNLIVKGIHWIISPNNRVMIDRINFEKWIAGKHPAVSV